MVLGFLKSNTVPIGIDFGYAELKLLQLSPGEQSQVAAMACVEIPDAARSNPAQRLAFLSEQLPRLLRDGGFKGKTAVCSIPAWQTYCQHRQVVPSESRNVTEQLKEQLQTVFTCRPDDLVIRHVDVTEVLREGQGGQPLQEVICFAVSHDVVMQQVELLKKCRLDIVGMHVEPTAILRAFDRLYRRDGDERTTTLYVDVGANATKVMVAHGRDLRFAKTVPMGGRVIDARLAEDMRCDAAAARAHRLSQCQIMRRRIEWNKETTGRVLGQHALFNKSRETGALPAQSADGSVAVADVRRTGQIPAEMRPVDPEDSAVSATSGVLESGIEEATQELVDELRMCLRYHHAMFPERRPDRMVILGGESRDARMGRRLAQGLSLPSFLGDPLGRMRIDPACRPLNVENAYVQPGWAVAVGLCLSPLEG